MNVHNLKCLPQYFLPLSQEIKTFEYRKNDRNYQIGDWLIIHEYDDQISGKIGYTGKSVSRIITYILQDVMNLPKGYCILGIKHPLDVHPPSPL
jgi:hypothetical protein